MDKEEQNEKHVVADKTTEKKYNASEEKRESSAKTMWTKLKNIFFNR
ncbi:hypothetical protein ACFQ3R_05380 [Mesonia ostreae]|uniref:Uncharacterized protein n=1 Tax=Mesonia ostreae TaxID=861110 RepID=A0ABU2KK09_9FLAO|nr:hypothetical protein [Mesonia ostreae]MDT0295045.1 hypothetical protein [Mesonia ostreae]